MYKTDKPNLFVRVRRWWKNAKASAKWHGWPKTLADDFIPSFPRINRLYWAIRHRTTDRYHIVKTDLPPEYYDIEILMLHSMFSLLCRYVEDEMHGVARCEKNIHDLETNWGQPPEINTPEFIEGDRLARQSQADNVKEALRLYKWWKEVYPLYEDNDPWTGIEAMKKKDHTNEFNWLESTPHSFDEDGDPTSFTLEMDRGLTPEQVEERHNLMDESRKYEKKNTAEIEANMIALVKLRQSLWT